MARSARAGLTGDAADRSPARTVARRRRRRRAPCGARLGSARRRRVSRVAARHRADPDRVRPGVLGARHDGGAPPRVAANRAGSAARAPGGARPRPAGARSWPPDDLGRRSRGVRPRGSRAAALARPRGDRVTVSDRALLPPLPHLRRGVRPRRQSRADAPRARPPAADAAAPRRGGVVSRAPRLPRRPGLAPRMGRARGADPAVGRLRQSGPFRRVARDADLPRNRLRARPGAPGRGRARGLVVAAGARAADPPLPAHDRDRRHGARPRLHAEPRGHRQHRRGAGRAPGASGLRGSRAVEPRARGPAPGAHRGLWRLDRPRAAARSLPGRSLREPAPAAPLEPRHARVLSGVRRRARRLSGHLFPVPAARAVARQDVLPVRAQ